MGETAVACRNKGKPHEQQAPEAGKAAKVQPQRILTPAEAKAKYEQTMMNE